MVCQGACWRDLPGLSSNPDGTARVDMVFCTTATGKPLVRLSTVPEKEDKHSHCGGPCFLAASYSTILF